MRMRALSVVIACVLASGPAFAAGKTSLCPKGDYEDTKSRFCVHQEPGWSLAPIPGDTSGMVFRKTLEGVPASLRVMVRVQRSGETTKQALDEIEDAFKSEIGYKAGGDVPASIGLLPAVRRTFSVYASGDKNTVRAIEVYALFAFGHAHLIHFETLEKKRGAFTRDLDRMLASYKALAGKGTYAPLAGTWINTGGGPDLTLEEDGHFKMGPLSGGYQADAGAIVLSVKEGGEKYRYQVSGNTLTLSSPNLGGDLVFKRSGAQRIKMDEPDKPKVTGPLTREQLIGTWKVIDKESTDPLKLQLAASGSCAFGPLSGRWRYSTGRLTITSTQNVTITYSASMEDGKLVLGGGDLESELTFIRE